MKTVLFILLWFYWQTGLAGVLESWTCYDRKDRSNRQVLAVAYVNDDKASGILKISGKTYKARYQESENERQWSFSSGSDSTGNYLFTIDKNGDGFSIVTDEHFLRCTQN